jgi:hypothetical protein
VFTQIFLHLDLFTGHKDQLCAPRIVYTILFYECNLSLYQSLPIFTSFIKVSLRQKSAQTSFDLGEDRRSRRPSCSAECLLHTDHQSTTPPPHPPSTGLLPPLHLRHQRCQQSARVCSEVLTATSVKMSVFWVVAPCSLVCVYQRFRGLYCLHHHRPGHGGTTHR